jgi:hypothetical protein
MSRAEQTRERNEKRDAMARWVGMTLVRHLPASRVTLQTGSDANRITVEDDDGTLYTVVVSRKRGQ